MASVTTTQNSTAINLTQGAEVLYCAGGKATSFENLYSSDFIMFRL